MSTEPDSIFQKPKLRMEFAPLNVVSIVQPVGPISEHGLKLNSQICDCAEKIQELERALNGNADAGTLSDRDLIALQAAFINRAVDFLIEALRSSDRWHFKKLLEVLYGPIIKEKGMTVVEFITLFENGKITDFSILAS